tara:strand:+ start:412 stop:1428 length:1017 start_codon:yes stop_codon:yes gene_type:complete
MKKKIKHSNVIIITGGSGYIGSCLAKYLSKEYRVITLDKKNKSPFLNKKIDHLKCNLNNKKKLLKIIKKINPKTIIHLAGQSTIDLVERKKVDYFKDNLLATKNLLEVIKNLKIKNLIFSSTAAVYEDFNNKISETGKIRSLNSYGISKIKCEELIKKKLNLIKSKYCILRFFNVASSIKKFKIGEFHNPETHLIPIIINSLFLKKKINIYGTNYKTKDGTCMRDYIHIIDILKGIEKSIKYLERKKSRSSIFNLGSGNCYSVMEIVKNCSKISKIKPIINFVKPRKHDVDFLLCEISKAKKILGWKPIYSNLNKIISDEIWWYKFLKKNNYKRKFIY